MFGRDALGKSVMSLSFGERVAWRSHGGTDQRRSSGMGGEVAIEVKVRDMVVIALG